MKAGSQTAVSLFMTLRSMLIVAYYTCSFQAIRKLAAVFVDPSELEDINSRVSSVIDSMIYGSSYSSSSSSSRAGFLPGQLAAEEFVDERRPLLQQYQSQSFWSSREPVRTEFGVLDITAQSQTSSASKGMMTKFLQKLETDHEPGVSSTQLMLINHDLKPGTVPLL